MTSSFTNVVQVVLQDLGPGEKAELVEFLRINVIHSGFRVNGLENEFKGTFTQDNAERIKRWIQEKSAEKKT